MPSTRTKRRKPIPRKNTRGHSVQRRMTLRNSADAGMVPDISAAMVAAHASWGEQYLDCQFLFDRARRPDDVGSIKLVGVAIDGERSGVVYVLAPATNVDKRTATQWRKRVEKWSASKEWLVTPLAAGAIELRKRLTPATYKALRKRHMPDDHMEVPRTFGAPIVPVAPITADVAKLITQRVAKRIAGSVPLGVTLRLIDALPGWSWHADTLARPMKGNLMEHFERKVLNKGKYSGEYRVEGNGPVEIHQYRDSLTPVHLKEILNHVTETGYATADFDHTDLPDGMYFTESAVFAPSRRWKVFGETPPTVVMLPRLLRAEAAVIVTAPSGNTFPLFRSDASHVGDPETSVIDAPAFWKFGYAEGLADTAEAMLENIDEITMREATSKAGMKDLSNTGECQFCVNTQKLEPNPARDGSHGRWAHTMVHHGFDYPESQGWRGGTLGQRRGSCPGVGWRPYEQAHDLLDKMLPGARERVQNAKALILSRERQKKDARKPITVTTMNLHRVEKEETFHPPTYEWERAMERAIGDAERELRAAESFLAWLTHRIDNWKLKPLYDELKAQRDAKRAEVTPWRRSRGTSRPAHRRLRGRLLRGLTSCLI